MKYVLKNQEMQDVDKETIQQIGMPGLVLMLSLIHICIFLFWEKTLCKSGRYGRVFVIIRFQRHI